MTHTRKMSISVAICTRERPQQLERLLASLNRQTRAPEEVLVIDNAPVTTRTEQLIRERFHACRYLTEPVQGLDFARNRALKECRTNFIAFIDDDAVAAPEWVEATARVFAESSNIAACMGRVDALSLETAGARLFEANGGFARGNKRIHLPPGTGIPPPGWPRPLIAWSISVGSGVSMALRRQVALDIGGFDEALDMGNVLPGGGDLDMIWRLLAVRHEIVYEPLVHAWHEHRRDFDAAELQILEHNRSLIAMLMKTMRQADPLTRIPVSAYLLWRLVKPAVRILKRLAGCDPLSVRMLGRLTVATWRGLSAYSAAVRLAAVRKSATGYDLGGGGNS